ncbi:MAG: hypothetical protein IKE94_02280 [Aeriscardovia sp.]|nr:hypothetical protein [Aeriscardovia sp.]MBR3463036.1 hypothetical protein [Clostridiales bacterium]
MASKSEGRDAARKKAKRATPGKIEPAATMKVVLIGGDNTAGKAPETVVKPLSGTKTGGDSLSGLLSNNKASDGKGMTSPYIELMTAKNADYYGAYLIPVSGAGALPRMNGEIIFAPLYKYKNGERVMLLKDVEVNDERYGGVPFLAKAFDFGKIPAGRYELVVILPFKECMYHFRDISIDQGEDKTVIVDLWNTEDDPASCFAGGRGKKGYKTVELSSDLYFLDGSSNGSLSGKKYGTVFALAVDSKGEKLWSVIGNSISDELKVPAYYGWCENDMWTGTEGDHIEPYPGQIYLFFSKKPVHITFYPVTYLSLYDEVWDEWGKFHSRSFERFMPGRIYCETAVRGKSDQKTYVAFWEKYQDAKGRVHYRTYNDPVSFELHWPVECYFEDAIDDEVHMAAAMPDNVNGVLYNYLNRAKLRKKGVSYDFRYTFKDSDIKGGTPFKKIPSSCAAEPVTLKDTLWELSGVEANLTGTAKMKKYVKDENGFEVMRYVTVDPVITKDSEGIALRFIVDSDHEPENSDSANVSSREEYCINLKSNKIHRPGCGCCKLISDENATCMRASSPSVNLKHDLTSSGYTLCKRCNP